MERKQQTTARDDAALAELIPAKCDAVRETTFANDPVNSVLNGNAAFDPLAVLNATSDGILVVGETGKILFSNQTCQRIFKYSGAQLSGKVFNELISQPTHCDENSVISEGLQYLVDFPPEGAMQEEYLMQGMRNGGERFALELRRTEVEKVGERQFVCIVKDLTFKHLVDEKLEQLHWQMVDMSRINAMDEVGSAISHELNQPLTALTLYIRAMQKRGESMQLADEFIDLVEKAKREAQRASLILKQMRDFHRAREPQRIPVEMKDLIDEAVELAVAGRNRDQVEIGLRIDKNLPKVELDPIQFQQVLVNLLRNAHDAVQGKKARRIIISASVNDERLLITIEDSGDGIPPEMRGKLFKSFATSKKSGTGLGLAISSIIVQSHGGDLMVEPKSTSMGAKFIIDIPINKK